VASRALRAARCDSQVRFATRFSIADTLASSVSKSARMGARSTTACKHARLLHIPLAPSPLYFDTYLPLLGRDYAAIALALSREEERAARRANDSLQVFSS